LIDPLQAATFESMGRFASNVEFYTRYREPYSPEHFRAVAEWLGLNGHEALLDVGCGPAQLAIGLAPFVASCAGLDPEPGMIEAAKTAAKQAGTHLTLHLGRIEDFTAGELFDVVTIGRALHWLDRRSALGVLDRIVSGQGHILVCHAASIETPATPWLKPYQEICRTWSEDPEREVYRLKAKDWFEGSLFRELDGVSVTQTRQVKVADLIGRALSKSNTSPAFLGKRQAEFEAVIQTTLEPFSQDGELQEEIVAGATVFGRAAL
jgi:SAM-dependent methyltransferase